MVSDTLEASHSANAAVHSQQLHCRLFVNNNALPIQWSWIWGLWTIWGLSPSLSSAWRKAAKQDAWWSVVDTATVKTSLPWKKKKDSVGLCDLDISPFCPKMGASVTCKWESITTKSEVSMTFVSGLLGLNGTNRQMENINTCNTCPHRNTHTVSVF